MSASFQTRLSPIALGLTEIDLAGLTPSQREDRLRRAERDLDLLAAELDQLKARIGSARQQLASRKPEEKSPRH